VLLVEPLLVELLLAELLLVDLPLVVLLLVELLDHFDPGLLCLVVVECILTCFSISKR
jgi:hypothetical protein